MDYLPVAIKLKDRPVIVVGGGKVAFRKIQNFLEAGARVHVIAPALDPRVMDQYKENKITWAQRPVEDADIQNADLIVSATNDKTVNDHVSRLSQKMGIPVNVVDQPHISNFISPAVIRSEEAIIAVYTDGKDPVLSRDLKNFIKEKWNDFLSFRDRS
jgi:uroporphyrin-III C-methyltransferase / precorrin-2 dehydrogenase / sirohydrochlorin ferrochelatase